MAIKKKAVFLTIVSLLALVAGFFISQHYLLRKKINLAHFHGTYLKDPRSVKPFHLKGLDHRAFDNSYFKGKWTFVFFGFTHCGYLCPTTMAELGKMYRILETKGAKLPQVVMISIDPERDSLGHLAAYVHSFNPHFSGATGKEKNIELMTSELGIVYQKVANRSDLKHSYDIQHSGAILLFNPQGQLNAFFTLPHEAKLLAKDYMLLVS